MSRPPHVGAAAGVASRRRPGGGFPSFRLLEALSFAASAIFAGLLLFWLGPSAPAATLALGWAHGLLWIGLSLLAIVAVRRGTIPFWLAVTVAVVGGVGPFAGTVGFLVESRRRTRRGQVSAPAQRKPVTNANRYCQATGCQSTRRPRS